MYLRTPEKVNKNLGKIMEMFVIIQLGTCLSNFKVLNNNFAKFFET